MKQIDRIVVVKCTNVLIGKTTEVYSFVVGLDGDANQCVRKGKAMCDALNEVLEGGPVALRFWLKTKVVTK